MKKSTTDFSMHEKCRKNIFLIRGYLYLCLKKLRKKEDLISTKFELVEHS